MTKDANKRKIIIDDKRGRPATGGPVDELKSGNADLLDELKLSTGDALNAVDDALSEFGGRTRETAGRAAMGEEVLRQSRQDSPPRTQPEWPKTPDHPEVPEQPQRPEVPQPGQRPEVPQPARQPETPKEQPERPETPQELAARHLELAQRKEAELQNFRKRVAKEKEDARRFAVEGLLFDLFPALDGLSQAAHTFKDQPAGQDPLLDGVRSTIRLLEEALKKHGIEKIDRAGVPFDPLLHQPLAVEENAGATGETVAEVYVEGFRLGDKVLKPAMVKVSRPPRPEVEGGAQ